MSGRILTQESQNNQISPLTLKQFSRKMWIRITPDLQTTSVYGKNTNTLPCFTVPVWSFSLLSSFHTPVLLPTNPIIDSSQWFALLLRNVPFLQIYWFSVVSVFPSHFGGTAAWLNGSTWDSALLMRNCLWRADYQEQLNLFQNYV